MATILVTVHGTFAPKAPWAQVNSPFCEAIRSALGDHLCVRPVDWTGDNTFDARLDAAAKLIQLLETIPPEDRVLIVAHSHGGSAVHYAYARRPDLFERVGASVCMATPFFGFSVRPGYEALVIAALFSAFLALLQITLFALAHLGHMAWSGFEESTGAVVGSGLLTLAVLLSAAVALFRRRHKLYALLEERGSRAAFLDTTVINAPRTTLVRSMGDEVAIGLTAAQFLCALTAAVLDLLAGIAKGCVLWLQARQRSVGGRLALILLAGLAVLVAALPGGFSLAVGTDPKYWIDLLWMWNKSFGCFVCSSTWADHSVRMVLQVAIAAVMLMEAVGVGLLVLFALSWLLSILSLRGLGAWDVIAALTLRFAIEPSPEGGKHFINAGWERSTEALMQSSWTLQHSNPYLSKAALEQIIPVLMRALDSSKTISRVDSDAAS